MQSACVQHNSGVVSSALAALLSLASCKEPTSDWKPGEVRRVVSTDYGSNIVLVWRTADGIEGYIRHTVNWDKDKELPAATDKDLFSLDTGTRVRLIASLACKGFADGSDRPYYKVRVESGRQKNAVCYVLKAYGDMDYLKGEPAVLVREKAVAGAFDDHTLDEFYKALDAGDDRQTQAYLGLRRVLVLREGTRLTIEEGFNDSGHIRARVLTGSYKGKALYFRALNVVVSYPVVPALPASPRPKEASSEAEGRAKVSPPSSDDKVVVGVLARARKAALIYAGPSSTAKTLSRVKPGDNLVVKKEGGKWLTVVMTDHRLAYISADAVKVLPYDYIEDRSKTVVTRGSNPVDASGPEEREARMAGEAVVSFAKKAKGTAHVAGGASLEFGVGSGEFVMLAYASAGFDLPPDPAEQCKWGVPVSNYADLRPGDRLYLLDARAKRIAQAAIYVGGGYVIMADPKQGKVATVYLTASLQKRTVAARRGGPRKSPVLPSLGSYSEP